MSASEPDPELAAEVGRIKNAALEHHKQTIRTLAVAFIVGVAVGVAVWFLQRPMDRDEVHLGFAGALGVATFLLGGLLSRTLLPRPIAKCPRCGCDWNVESENSIQTWLTWYCCPGCGLPMNEEAHMQRGPNHTLNPPGNRPAS